MFLITEDEVIQTNDIYRFHKIPSEAFHWGTSEKKE